MAGSWERLGKAWAGISDQQWRESEEKATKRMFDDDGESEKEIVERQRRDDDRCFVPHNKR